MKRNARFQMGIQQERKRRIPKNNSNPTITDNSDVSSSDSMQSTIAEAQAQITETQAITKSLFHSKIFWVNIIALVCLFLQVKFGWVIDESAQMQILAVINIILRYFTKEGVYI